MSNILAGRYSPVVCWRILSSLLQSTCTTLLMDDMEHFVERLFLCLCVCGGISLLLISRYGGFVDNSWRLLDHDASGKLLLLRWELHV